MLHVEQAVESAVRDVMRGMTLRMEDAEAAIRMRVFATDKNAEFTVCVLAWQANYRMVTVRVRASGYDKTLRFIEDTYRQNPAESFFAGFAYAARRRRRIWMLLIGGISCAALLLKFW
jgi:hypothetical protein